MERGNPAALLSLIAGVFLVVFHLVACCLGCMPLFGVLSCFLLPVIWVLDFAAIGAGIAGLAESRHTGLGAAPSVAGLAIGVCSVLLQVVGVGLWTAMMMLAMVAEAL